MSRQVKFPLSNWHVTTTLPPLSKLFSIKFKAFQCKLIKTEWHIICIGNLTKGPINNSSIGSDNSLVAWCIYASFDLNELTLILSNELVRHFHVRSWLKNIDNTKI